MYIDVDEEMVEGLTFISKYILLPMFVLYLLCVEVLFWCGLYRQALTLAFLVFSINAMIWNRKVFR